MSQFRFLEQASPSSNEDEAQKFLDEKLAKNKYTIKQQERLDANGGPTVANATEGFTPKSNSPAASSEPVLNDMGDESRYGGVDSYGNWNSEWDNSATQQQLKASGALDPTSELAKQFASLNEDGGSRVDDEEGWKELSFDEDVKTAEQYEAQVKQWQDAGYDVRAIDMKPGEYAHSNLAVREGTMQNAPEVVEEKEPEPIVHSPEIKQAKERVRSYENDALSGKTSEDIYGENTSDKYSFDATKGAAGIGTPLNGDSFDKANEASQSFLEKKKLELIN